MLCMMGEKKKLDDIIQQIISCFLRLSSLASQVRAAIIFTRVQFSGKIDREARKSKENIPRTINRTGGGDKLEIYRKRCQGHSFSTWLEIFLFSLDIYLFLMQFFEAGLAQNEIGYRIHIKRRRMNNDILFFLLSVINGEATRVIASRERGCYSQEGRSLCNPSILFSFPFLFSSALLACMFRTTLDNTVCYYFCVYCIRVNIRTTDHL